MVWPFLLRLPLLRLSLSCGCWPCGFSCGPPSLVVPVCVWGSSEAAELCLLSLLLLGVGQAIVEPLLVWLLCLFLGRLRFSAACPAADYPSRVTQPFWLQLAGLLLQWRFVIGLAVSLVRHLVFYLVPCSSSGACSLRSLPLEGFLPFLSPGA